MSFVNLHGHSHYSLLDGFGSPEEIILRCKELDYPACGLTDHGVVYGLIEFYQAGKKHGVKPILGCEMYVAKRTRFDRDAKIDAKSYHLTVLAKNKTGYQNLLKLVTQAHLEGFYYKPRVDYGLLKAHSDGLIVLSGCLASHLSQAILSGDEEEIDKVIKTHIDIFGKENYYLEVQDHPLVENMKLVADKKKELAKKYDLPLVATNDSHYPRPEDSDAHDVLLCIQTGCTVNDSDRMRYVDDFSIRPIEDLSKAFEDTPEAIDNTLAIAERCDIEFEFGENLIPSFATPNSMDPAVYLKELCVDGLKNRFDGKPVPDEYLERLEYELGVVKNMGFNTYFLIVSDFVREAKSKEIVVGPGRGSAAGSIIAWSLDITDVDPIAYGLFFERFLNPERISMPDIDIDFADTRRDEVLNYVVEKYGRQNVAQVLTFGTMAPRAAVRDVGRALGYPYAEVDALAKIVPPPVLGKNVPLEITTKEDPDLKKVYENDPRAKPLLDYAIKLEGTVRHVGTHACAVIISENPLTEYTAMQNGAGGGGEIVTQYSAEPLEKLGLLKMDFLGLRNLTIIENTLKILKATKDIEVDLDNLPLDDKATYELFQRGDTTGVFQFESGGMKRYLKQLKPTIFDDIVAMGALYRPGPMEWIPTYIKGKHDPKSVKYLDDSFKEILERTYGVAVYQEQILQIARDFAGFSLGEADILRKAVGKKIPSLLEEQKEKFSKGAVSKGHDQKFAHEVFEKVIEPFAGYGFNKAHAVCYGMIAYRTAYLKANYPVEFMTALLCSDAQNTDRVVLEIKECSDMGIEVLPPSINESYTNFTLVDDKTIRFGLMAIKGVGEGPINEIIEERKKNGQFKSLENMAKRVPIKVLNKKLIQALAYSGALDQFGDRRKLAENYDEIVDFAKHMQNSVSQGQTDIFGIMQPEDAGDNSLHMNPFPPISSVEKLKKEKELLGMYVSGHPLSGLSKYIQKKGDLIARLSKKNLGKTVKVVGLISNMRKIMTKSGGYMAVFTIEDPSASVNAVMFPQSYSKYGNLLNEDAVMAFSGKLDHRQGQYQIIVDVAKALAIDTMVANAKEQGYFNPEEKLGVGIRSLDDILKDAENSDEEKSEELSDFFVIKLPENPAPDKLSELKSLLLENRGEVSVELHLNGAKKIKLPFGITPSDALSSKIKELFQFMD